MSEMSLGIKTVIANKGGKVNFVSVRVFILYVGWTYLNWIKTTFY